MLTFKAGKTQIQITECDTIVRGMVGYECKIILDDYWKDYVNTVVFKRYDTEPINIIVTELDNTIIIPTEILATSGEFKLGIFGVRDNEIHPTLWSEPIRINYGTDTCGTDPIPITPDEYQQILTIMNQKQDKLIAGNNITIKNNIISATGGGSVAEEKWELIIDYTVDEPVTRVMIDKDMNGNPFSLKKAYVVAKQHYYDGTTPSAGLSLDKDFSTYGCTSFQISKRAKTEDEQIWISYYLVRVDGVGVVPLEQKISINGNFYTALEIMAGTSYASGELNPKTSNQKMDCLAIASYVPCFVAGDQYLLYGVRE